MTEEYMVEVYCNGSFSRQIDACTTYDDAVALALASMDDIEEVERIHITTVRYENGVEVSMASEPLALDIAHIPAGQK